MNFHANIQTEKPRLLIVENDRDILCTLELECADKFRLTLASSAREAIGHISDQSEIDFLLTDLDLGEPLDGLDVALAMRTKFPTTRIALMSASSRHHPRVTKFLELSNSVYLKKPFTLEELQSTLDLEHIARVTR